MNGIVDDYLKAEWNAPKWRWLQKSIGICTMDWATHTHGPPPWPQYPSVMPSAHWDSSGSSGSGGHSTGFGGRGVDGSLRAHHNTDCGQPMLTPFQLHQSHTKNDHLKYTTRITTSKHFSKSIDWMATLALTLCSHKFQRLLTEWHPFATRSLCRVHLRLLSPLSLSHFLSFSLAIKIYFRSLIQFRVVWSVLLVQSNWVFFFYFFFFVNFARQSHISGITGMPCKCSRRYGACLCGIVAPSKWIFRLLNGILSKRREWEVGAG